MSTPSLLRRLKERKLVQWALAYLAGSWFLVESTNLVVDRFQWPEMIGQAAIVLATIGFFITLILAWYHGEKGRQRVSGPELLMVAALLVVAGGVLSMLPGGREAVGPEKVPQDPLAADRRSIAVLPCDNISPNPEDGYLADGIHEEILLRLTRISGLTSMGRKSVESYREGPPPIGQIASELGVGFVGECSVRKDPQAERIRLTFQLLDSRGVQIWAENFDRDLTAGDLFEIQSDVALQIATNIGAAVSPEEQFSLEAKPTENSEAYIFFLRGWDYWVRPGYRETNWVIAEDLWRRAIEMDGSFALARARLSFLHGRMYFFSFDLSSERLAAQEAEAREALRLQPDLPEAHFALAYTYYVRGDLKEALDEFQIAQQKAPNDAATSAFIGYTYRRLGDWKSWEQSYLRTLQLNPRDVDIPYNLGANTLTFVRRYEDALKAADRALELAPDFSSASLQRGLIFAAWKGDTEPYRDVLEALPPEEALLSHLTMAWWDRDPERVFELLQMAPEIMEAQTSITTRSLEAGLAYRMLGDEASALEEFSSALTLLEPLLEEGDDFRVFGAIGFAYAGVGRSQEAIESAHEYVEKGPTSPDDVFFRMELLEEEAGVLAQAGQAEEAIDRLEYLLSNPSWVTVPLLRIDPIWDPLRSNPRFQALVEEWRDGVERS